MILSVSPDIMFIRNVWIASSRLCAVATTSAFISFAAASRALRLNVPQMAHELDFLPLLNFKASSSVTSKILIFLMST